MMMKIENLKQGTPEWHAFRADHYGASEAAAMLGLSQYMTRTELLDLKVSGVGKEHDEGTLARFKRGHETEALARTIVEDIVGDDLYPLTCSDGLLSASCDGLTMPEKEQDRVAFEHKLWNEELAAALRADVVPDPYMPQIQQVLMVTGAKQLIFVCSDGTRDNMAMTTVYPSEEWFNKLHAGWDQFHSDRKTHKPTVMADAPQAEAILDLPVLSIRVNGDVSIAGNLPRFREDADRYLREIKKDGFATDKDFVDADENAKFCRARESDLELTKKHILAQTATVDEVIKLVDFYKEQFRRVAIDLEKAVKKEKEARRLAIIAEAQSAYAEYIAILNAEIAPAALRVPAPNFAEAAKGYQKLSSLTDAVMTALAAGKIEADAAARSIRTNLALYQTLTEGEGHSYAFLFADLSTIIHQPEATLNVIIRDRITTYKTEQDARREAEAAKIREEEAAKLKAAPEAAQVRTTEAATASSAMVADKGGQNSFGAAIEPQINPGQTPEFKPTDDDLIAFIAQSYRVDALTVISWLMTCDLKAAAIRASRSTTGD